MAEESEARKKVPAFFYKTEAGGEPVREWLKTLSKDDKKLIGEDIQDLRVGLASWDASIA